MKISLQSPEAIAPIQDFEYGSVEFSHPLRNEGFFIPQETHILGGRSLAVGKNKVNWTAEIPESTTYDGIVYFASGYGAIKQTSSSIRNALAEHGYLSITAEPSRRSEGGLMKRLKDPQEIHARTMMSVIGAVQESSVLKRLNPEINFDKVLVVTHSMGGLAATQAIELGLEPEAVINIAAAGLGSPTLRELVKNVPAGLIPSIKHEIIPAVQSGHIKLDKTHIFKMARHLLTSPSQTLAEGISCLTTNNSELVARQRENGIKVGYIALKHDMLVRSIPEYLQSNGLVDSAIEIANAGHLFPQKNPKEMARLIVEMHRDLITTDLRLVSA